MPNELQNKLENELNNDNFKEQVKNTLLAVLELQNIFQTLSEHYEQSLKTLEFHTDKSTVAYEDFMREKADLEARFKESFNELRSQSDELQARLNSGGELLESFKLIESSINAIYGDIKEYDEKINTLYNAMDFSALDEKAAQLNEQKAQISAFIIDLGQKKNELANELDALKNSHLSGVMDMYSKLQEMNKTLSNKEASFSTDLDAAKQNAVDFVRLETRGFQKEISTFLQAEKVKLSEYVQNFRNSLDELDFTQTLEPAGALNQSSWLDTSKGIIKIYGKNPKIRFIGSREPDTFTRLSDLWLNSANNTLHLFKASEEGNNFTPLQMRAFDFDKIDFKQENEPEINPAHNEFYEGRAWLKMNALKVFYLENNAFVQIDKKLVRFTGAQAPAAPQIVQYNDIWAKSENEVFIYTKKSATESGWVRLNEAYKYAKFKRLTLPDESEIATDDTDSNKVFMRDLVFIVDESELYYYLKSSYNGSDEVTYGWVRASVALANARFKQEAEPKELMPNDLFFQTLSDDAKSEEGSKGVLKIWQASSYDYAWMSLEAVKKYATFKDEVEPKAENLSGNEIWYKPYSKELFLRVENAWKKIYNIGFDESGQLVLPKDYPQGQTLNRIGATTLLDMQNEGASEANFAKYCITLNESPKRVYLCVKKGKDFSWDLSNADIKGFVWQNELENKINAIESLLVPDGSAYDKVNNKELIEVKNYPQQIVNFNILKKNVDSINEYINNSVQVLNNTIQNSINNLDRKLQTNINNLAHLHRNDWVYLTNAPIDFALGKNFYLTLTHHQNLAAINGNIQGKSGCIFVTGANLITGFNSPFNWRVGQTGFQGWELFSYCIINQTVRLARS